MTKEELDRILEEHKKWLTGDGSKRADLRCADLSHADLRYADLGGANLRDADLRYADLRGAKGEIPMHVCPYNCPEFGSFIGFKKARASILDETDVIVQLQITENAKRCSGTSRKCRCDEAMVLSITSLDGSKSYSSAVSKHDNCFIYKVGEKVRVDDFDDNRWKECSTGIHFFIARDEAVNY